MSFPARFVIGTAETGDFDSEAAGTVHGHSALSTANIAEGTLSCTFVVEAETNTLTIAGKWQVSDDNSTWVDIGPQNNAAVVVLGTGTAGDDAVVTKCLEAPSGVLGWKYVRPAVVSGVASGNAVDTWSMQVRYRKFNGFS